MQCTAGMVKGHQWGLINAVVSCITNAASERRNARIQWLKRNGCGFRNRERLRNAIYFHCGDVALVTDTATQPLKKPAPASCRTEGRRAGPCARRWTGAYDDSMIDHPVVAPRSFR